MSTAGVMMHVRVKRHNQTIFILSEPSDTFGRIRAKLQKLVGVPLGHIRLYGPDKRRPLEDEALLSDHNIQDDAILYMTLQVDGAWEEIAVTSYDDAASGAAASSSKK